MEEKEIVKFTMDSVLFWVSLLGMLITILTVWSRMVNKLKDSETGLQVRLKDHEVQIIRLDRDFMALSQKHDRDMQLIREDFEKKIDEIIIHNREDHSKMFDKMERINSTMSGMSAALREHLKQTEDKGHVGD